jgi:alpha-tubulin suppressor-like RCC1 family protein
VLTTRGAVLCAGANTLGQLGDGTTTDRAELAPVTGLANATSIAAGRFHTCALTDEGDVYCWGANIDGAAGATARDLRERVVVPTRVALTTPTRSLSAGGVRTCVADEANVLRCFGAGARRPIEIARDVGAIAAQTHVIAWLDAENGVHVQGEWPEQPEGLEGTEITPLPDPTERLTTITVGPRHACGLRLDGTLACWGDSADGRLAGEPRAAR